MAQANEIRGNMYAAAPGWIKLEWTLKKIIIPAHFSIFEDRQVVLQGIQGGLGAAGDV